MDHLPHFLQLIHIKVGKSVDTSLLDTANDCLRFVTEFFEVISQSASHIYHSALPLAPRSSTVRKYMVDTSTPLDRGF